MNRKDLDFNHDAYNDAFAMMDNFIDEIVAQAREGTVSTDFNNDYRDGDEYHHLTHVDKSYNLTEAAAILDQLVLDEETDNGLWQGLAPRDAISTQAAFTYGNAVASRWQSEIGEINALLEELDANASEETREAVARCYVHLAPVCYDVPPATSTDAVKTLYHLAQDAKRDLPCIDMTRVYLDAAEDNGFRPSTVKGLRSAIAAADLATAEQTADNPHEFDDPANVDPS